MAANTNPVFIELPRCWAVTISSADTSLTAPTTSGTVLTAGTDGSLVECVRIKAVGTTTAGMVRLFLYDPGNPVYWLLDEIAVTALTPSATTASFAATWTPPTPTGGGPGMLPVPANWQLRITTHNAEAFDVVALGG